MNRDLLERTGRVLALAALAVGCVGLASHSAAGATPRTSIAGTVRDAVTGEPVGGVSVTVFSLQSNGAPSGDIVYGAGFLTDTQTASNGTYRVAVPASDANGYWVCFDTGLFGPYEFQCWADQSTFDYPFPDPLGFFQLPDQSRTIQVTAGQHIAGIDGDLIHPVPPGSPSPTGSVSGQITAQGSGAGVAGVTVVALNAAGLPVGHAVTALHGAYRLDNLAPSTADRICIDPTNAVVGSTPSAFHGRCYTSSRWRASTPPPSDATLVTVTIGTTTAHINVALLPGAGG